MSDPSGPRVKKVSFISNLFRSPVFVTDAVSIAAAGRFVGSRDRAKEGPCASRLSVSESMCFLLGDQRRKHVPTKNHRASPGMDLRKLQPIYQDFPMRLSHVSH